MTTRARAFYLLKKSDKSDFIRLFKSDFIRLFKIRSTALIGMVIIGHMSSKSTLGANKIIIEILGSRYSFGRGPFGRILEWRGELQSKEWLQHRRGRLHRLCLYCSEVRWDPTGNSEAKIWLNPTYNKEFDGSELLSLVPDYHWCILLTFDLYMNEVIAF